MNDYSRLIERAELLLERLERILPAAPAEPDWDAAIAFRWRRKNGIGLLQPILRPHGIRLADLHDIDDQKSRLTQNTRQFLAGKRANNALLTGARGTGKSSLVKALLNEFAPAGLRLIEIDKDDLVDVPDIVDIVRDRPEHFILFCDDLSFEDAEPSYKALKSVLDGSVAAVPDNVLLYATSNRRHLMPEYFDENRQTKHVDGEVHPAEAVEEKISLSERFGLWLSFYPFSQDEYLTIVRHWLSEFGVSGPDIAAARGEALQWALLRGSRTGRVAWQFARDYAGRFEA
ncbi:MAG: ATP-binding protein [Zoogloea sp.]|nr:ATP-binding protein [Zoogloea sp.]